MTDILKTPSYPNNKLFGRKWKISVLVPLSESSETNEYTAYVLSDSDQEDLSLKVTFKIQKFGWTIPNFSEITVYNVRPDYEKILFKNGMRVMVEAGYQNGDFGVIYDAPIFQPLWEKEDNVTSKLTFRCVDALGMIYDNHVETIGTPLDHQKSMVEQMMSRARVPFSATLSDKLVSNKLARPKVFFDSPLYYLRKYAQQNGTLPSVINNEVVVDKPQSKVTTNLQENALVVSPGKGGLIGVPTQTQDGVEFTLLLNPIISIFNPPMLIKIDNSFIRQTSLQYNTAGFSRLDEDFTYRVIGVTHVGDTRGNDWYSKVVGINQSMEGLRGAMFQTEQDTIN